MSTTNLIPGISQHKVKTNRLEIDNYQAYGGQYREVVLPDCGHSPHIEKQNEVLKLFTEFMNTN